MKLLTRFLRWVLRRKAKQVLTGVTGKRYEIQKPSLRKDN